jgi:hypothetical protein
MTYLSALAQLCSGNRTEIEADLSAAQAEYEMAQVTLENARRRIHMLEGLLATPSGIESPKVQTGDQMTLHAAMQKVLRESPTGKLRAGEIIAEIGRLNLYRMKDGRLPESQQIHARANHYPELFGKDGPFFFAK